MVSDHLIVPWLYFLTIVRGVRGIFFKGGSRGGGGAKSLFLIFYQHEKCFPCSNFHFSRPQTNFSVSKKLQPQKKSKQTQQQTTNESPTMLIFIPFMLLFKDFPSFPFTIFLLFFFIFSFLFASFIFPVSQQKDPCDKCLDTNFFL